MNSGSSPATTLSPEATTQNSKLKIHNSTFALTTLLILLIGLAVRVGYWQDARHYALRGDEPDYVLPAQTLTREGQYVDTFIVPGRTWTRVPLTSLLFAGSFLLVPDSAAAHAQGDDAALMEPRYDALNILQIILSLITVGIIMALAARCFPEASLRAATIAGLIAALYPPLASSAAQNALSETTAIMLIFGALYAFSLWRPGLSVRTSLGVAALGGLLLGAASLARPIALTFLPFALIWFMVVYLLAYRPEWRVSFPQWLRARRVPLLSGLVATVTCLLAISPWTLYNYNHYGRFLLLDTASATAFWNYHNYRGEDITARMWALPNPADRLSLIVQEGTANILEYPDKAIRGTWFALGYFWHLESNSAVLLNPWDMTQRDPDVPDLLHTDAAFLLVGLAGMAGLAGVGLRKPTGMAGRTLLLINLWLLASVLLGLIVPYDARYRMPAAPSIIILAAGLLALADWRAVLTGRAFGSLRLYPWVVVGTALLSVWVVWGAYSPNIPPLLRSEYQAWRGDIAPSAAPGRYALAVAAFPGFYWPYRHAADAARVAGRDDEARSLYAKSLALNPDDPYGLLGFADLASRHPDWQLTAQERKALSHEEDDWRGNPWDSSAPSPTSTVDIGTGSDIGYITGFQKPEQAPGGLTYRWSKGRSHLRVPVPAGTTPKTLVLRLAAPALGPAQPMTVTIAVNGAAPVTLEIPPAWADYAVPLTGVQPGSTLWVDISSPTLSPAVLQPGSKDTRNLGVGLDRISLAP